MISPHKVSRTGIALYTLLALSLVLPIIISPANGAAAETLFPQTGYSIWGPFESYWQAHGGLAQFGMPRTSVYHADKDYDAQWFERAVFTYDPSKPDPYKVELNLLGSQITSGRHAEAAFMAAKQGAQGHYFSETAHNLSGKFLAYWQQTGGLPIYGYPISEPFMEQSKSDGRSYLVQYFERNRFELHPELAGTQFEVQLGLLGSELLDAQGGPQAVAAAPRPAYYPTPTSGAHVPPGGIVQSPNAGTPEPGNNSVPPAPPLPPTQTKIMFASDFSSPDLSPWLMLGAYSPPDVTGASWSVSNGILQQSGLASEEGASDDALLVTRDSFADSTLDAYFYAGGGEGAGVVTRYSAQGYYLLKIYASAPNTAPKALLLKETKSSGESTLASSSNWPGYSPKTWYRLTLSAVGDTLTASVDGVQVAAATDPDLKDGSAGLYAYADGRARFDNFRVSAP